MVRFCSSLAFDSMRMRQKRFFEGEFDNLLVRTVHFGEDLLERNSVFARDDDELARISTVCTFHREYIRNRERATHGSRNQRAASRNGKKNREHVYETSGRRIEEDNSSSRYPAKRTNERTKYVTFFIHKSIKLSIPVASRLFQSVDNIDRR